jgi:hypothetical protein
MLGDPEPENLEGAIAEVIGDAVRDLLFKIGTSAICRGCGCAIWWIKDQKGKLQPYSCDGMNHDVSCANAASFRRDPRNERFPLSR